MAVAPDAEAIKSEIEFENINPGLTEDSKLQGFDGTRDKVPT